MRRMARNPVSEPRWPMYVNVSEPFLRRCERGERAVDADGAKVRERAVATDVRKERASRGFEMCVNRERAGQGDVRNMRASRLSGRAWIRSEPMEGDVRDARASRENAGI
jgi:hypothetical protein